MPSIHISPTALRPRLVVGHLRVNNFAAQDGDKDVNFYIPHDDHFYLGKDPTLCAGHIWWHDHDYVDGVHCILRTFFDGDGENYMVALTDCSNNGTFIDGERLAPAETRLLPDGCTVSLGGTSPTCPEFYFTFIPAGHVFALYEPLGYIRSRSESLNEVIKVRGRRTSQTYAVKVIRAGLTPDTKAEHLRKIAHMLSVAHPNILRVRVVRLHKDNIYLVSDYAPYEDLGNLIPPGQGMNKQTARSIVRSVCLALDHLHAHHTIHRNVKPSNILVLDLDRPMVKLSGFGFIKTPGQGDGPYDIRGTLRYMPPEAFQNFQTFQPSAKFDSWSMGVTTFYMLSGKFPFLPPRINGPNIAPEIDTEIKWEEFPLEDNLARDFISGLLQLDAENRMSITDALEHPWLKEDVYTITD